MPIYTYWCDNCKVDAELLVPMAERDDEYKHGCGTTLRRLLDRPGLVWSPTSDGPDHK